MDSFIPLRHLAAAALAAGIAVTVGGCTGTPSTTPTAAPMTAGPTPAPSEAGPFSFATWTERQGFGGSSGLNSVRTLARWLTEHRSEITTILLDTDVCARGDVAALIEWLDLHEPTACWADFHTAMRASLQKLMDDYQVVRVEVAAGETASERAVGALFEQSMVVYEMKPPANCP